MPSYTPPVEDLTPPIPNDPREWARNKLGTRLRRFYSSNPQGVNIFRLTDGTYTRQQPVSQDDIDRVFYGGHIEPVTAAEKAALDSFGQGTTKTFDARVYPNCIYNWDASLLTANVGDPIASWPGLLGPTLTQSTVSRRPTYQLNGGYPVVRFDGTDDYLAGTAAAATGQPLTLFLVLSDETVTGTSVPMSMLSPTPTRGCEFLSTAAVADFRALSTSTAFDQMTATRSATLRLWTGIVVGSGETSMRVNSVRSPTNHSFSATAATNLARQPAASANVSLGAQLFSDTASFFAKCDIAEFVCIAGSLDLSDIQTAETALAAKWGVTL